MPTAPKVFNALWDGLTPRQKEVVIGRFGLDKSGEPLTLAALGDQHGVTRERIRQIEASSLEYLKKKIMADPECVNVLERSKRYLKDAGGVARQDAFLAFAESALEGVTENHLALLIESSKAFHVHSEDADYFTTYYLDKNAFRAATAFVDQWLAFLRTKKSQVLGGAYESLFAEFIKNKKTPKQYAQNYLAISKNIGVSPYGIVGLAEWPEVNPRTIRDRIYLALKKKSEPMHFRDIADFINKAKLGKRAASAPTVHNELIKDSRFVLVGRGMYGLAEHGYEPGTAREVIHRILKKSGGLPPKNVILAVQKERFFKPNTILVNLQNKTFFTRLSDGTYRVRES